MTQYKAEPPIVTSGDSPAGVTHSVILRNVLSSPLSWSSHQGIWACVIEWCPHETEPFFFFQKVRCPANLVSNLMAQMLIKNEDDLLNAD